MSRHGWGRMPRLGCRAELQMLRSAGSDRAVGAEHAQQDRAARGSAHSRSRAGASASLRRGRAFEPPDLVRFDPRDL